MLSPLKIVTREKVESIYLSDQKRKTLRHGDSDGVSATHCPPLALSLSHRSGTSQEKSLLIQ